MSSYLPVSRSILQHTPPFSVIVLVVMGLILYALLSIRVGTDVYGMGGTSRFIRFYVPLCPTYLSLRVGTHGQFSAYRAEDDFERTPYIPSFNQSRLVM